MAPAQHDAVHAEQAEVLAEKLHGVLGAERRRAAQVGDRADAAFLYGKADQPVGEHAGAVHHEVHHHGVVGVLRAAQAGLDDGEPGLHEHDEEAGDQRPHEVDGDLVLADLVDDVGKRQALLRVADRDVGRPCR